MSVYMVVGNTHASHALHHHPLNPLLSSSQNSAASSAAYNVKTALSSESRTRDPGADPKRRSTLGFCNLHHRSIRVQNWGSILYPILYHTIYHTILYCPELGDPPAGLGLEPRAIRGNRRSGSTGALRLPFLPAAVGGAGRCSLLRNSFFCLYYYMASSGPLVMR